MKNKRIFPIFVHPGRCEPRCYFCHPTTGMEPINAPHEVEQRIGKRLDLLSEWRSEPIEIGVYGAFFDLPAQNIQAILDRFRHLYERHQVTGIRVAMRPDHVNEDSIAELIASGVSKVELDIPTLVPSVITHMGRGHDVVSLQRTVGCLNRLGVVWGAQLRPGLPGSTVPLELDHLPKIVELRPNFVRICPTLVLRGTWLEALYREDRYCPWNLDTTVAFIAQVLDRFSHAKIPVARIGLQPTHDLGLSDAVVAGPFHPSLRTLAESQRWYLRAVRSIASASMYVKALVLRAHPAVVPFVRGPENVNLGRLRQDYHLDALRVVPDSGLSIYDLEVEQDRETAASFFVNHVNYFGEWPT